jgi:hypothetical protein
VDGLARVILGEGLRLATVALRPFLGQETLGAVAGSFELSVRHGGRPTGCLERHSVSSFSLDARSQVQ